MSLPGPPSAKRCRHVAGRGLAPWREDNGPHGAILERDFQEHREMRGRCNDQPGPFASGSGEHTRLGCDCPASTPDKPLLTRLVPLATVIFARIKERPSSLSQPQLVSGADAGHYTRDSPGRMLPELSRSELFFDDNLERLLLPCMLVILWESDVARLWARPVSAVWR
jgi:hypothetical protein